MGEGNVQVAVRCRPLNEREKTAKRTAIVQCRPNSNEIAVVKRRSYTFDKVFGQYSSQKDVFKTTVKPVVDEALAGYNCTVFAYGQTGTGKTHTMQGPSLSPDSEDAGIIPRAVRYIFEMLQSTSQEYSVKVSFLQLYNEELHDLLAPESKKLRLMEDIKRGGIYCQNLLEVTTATAPQVYELLETGVKNRMTSETLMNENSSRSHSIFTIRIHSKDKHAAGKTVPGEDLLKIGQLNLVDLAGSECIGRSGARNVRAREAGNINQSLLTLGRVITALVDNNPHVPYRDSKLTRLLQESLGGRAKTTIIATLAPCADSLDETLSTLEYAFRARNIKNRPEMNQKLSKTVLLKEYGSEIEMLRSALQTARSKDGVYIQPDEFAEIQERLSGQTVQIAELEDELENRAKTCKELEEQLDLQREELMGVKREKIELEATLAKREEELENTRNELMQTKTDLAEARDVVSAYHSNEQVLLHSGRSGTRMFHESEHRGDLLYDKLSRKERVETHNNELATSFADDSRLQLSSFESRLIEHQKRQEMMAVDVESAMQVLQDAHDSDVTELTKTLGELQSAMQDRVKQEEVEAQTDSRDAEEDKTEWQSALTKRERDMQRRLEEFLSLSQQHTQCIIDQVASTKKARLANLSELATSVASSRKEMSVFLNEQGERLAQLKETLQRSFDEQANQLSNHKDQLVDSLRVGQQEQASQLEDMKTQLTQLIEQSILGQRRRVEQEMRLVATHVEGQQKYLKDQQHLVGSELDVSTTANTEAEATQDMQFSNLQKRMTMMREDVETHSEEQTREVREQDNARAQWRDEMSEVEKHHCEQLSEIASVHCERATTRRRKRSENVLSFVGSHENLRLRLAHGYKSTASHLATHVGDAKSKSTASAQAAKEVLGESAAMSSQTKEKLNEFMKERHVDAPTGTTPTKRSGPTAFPSFPSTVVDPRVKDKLQLVATSPIVSLNAAMDLPSQSRAQSPLEPEAQSSVEPQPDLRNDPTPDASKENNSPISDDVGPSPTDDTESTSSSNSFPIVEKPDATTKPAASSRADPLTPSKRDKLGLKPGLVRKRPLSGNTSRFGTAGGAGSSLAAPKRYRMMKKPGLTDFGNKTKR